MSRLFAEHRTASILVFCREFMMGSCSFFHLRAVYYLSFCEWPLMVASIFFLVMVNYLECFCKEQYIRLASIFSSVVLSFGMVL